MIPLKIQFFGGFSITCGGCTAADTANRSRKLWTLLEYLVTFRSRAVPQEELIELLWPDGGTDNPTGSLKTLVYRARTLLDSLRPGLGRELLTYGRGAYQWNDAVPAQLDIEVFETDLRLAAEAGDDRRRLTLLLEAAGLYGGDFLPRMSGESWVLPLSVYYHTRYLTGVRQAVGLLEEQKRWDESIALCRQAIAVDAYDEDIHASLIRGLWQTGERQQAQLHYNSVISLFFARFGIRPSGKLTEVYQEILRADGAVRLDLDNIQKHLYRAYAPGPLFCEYAVFQDFCDLYRRTLTRTGEPVQLCLLTLRSDAAAPQRISRVMERLHAVISGRLRRSDVFTRCSVSQYLLLLPRVTPEEAAQTAQRLCRAFAESGVGGGMTVEASLQPLEPDAGAPVPDDCGLPVRAKLR